VCVCREETQLLRFKYSLNNDLQFTCKDPSLIPTLYFEYSSNLELSVLTDRLHNRRSFHRKYGTGCVSLH